MEWTPFSAGTLAVAASLALIPLAGSADTLDQPYLVTTTSQTATGTVSYRDVMIVRADNTAVAPNADAVDRDRSCYGILQRVLTTGAVSKPYTIGIALDDNNIVPVPMKASVQQPAIGARLVQANGDAGGDLVSASAQIGIGVHVDARALAQNGHLEAATLNTVTYLTNGMQAVETSACAIQRLPQAPPSDGTEPPVTAQPLSPA
jgi:hypothetical protein